MDNVHSSAWGGQKVVDIGGTSRQGSVTNVCMSCMYVGMRVEVWMTVELDWSDLFARLEDTEVQRVDAKQSVTYRTVGTGSE